MNEKSVNIDGLKKDFYKLLSKYSRALKLVNILEANGELILFGGVIREYIDSQFENMPRDFDIVFNKKESHTNLDVLLKQFDYKKNRFGGYKLVVDSLEFDIWGIEDTWAFKEDKIQCSEKNYPKRLHETVFLNIDSIVYNLSNNDFHDEIYNNAMEKKVLDIVLNENPYKELNLLRAILFKRKYNMGLSNKLVKSIVNYTREENKYLDILYNIQLSHYRCEKISKSILNKELNYILKKQLSPEYEMLYGRNN